MATALAVLAVGAIPVIAEIDESMTLDPADVEAKITPRTRAVIPVHMMGLPADMGKLATLAKRRGLRLVEDACQAVGGSYRGRRLGTIGHTGALSFNHFKIIACGEGGAMLTSDRIAYEKGLIQHDGGCAFRRHAGSLSVPIFTGGNMRASEIMGAIMRVQLGRLDRILKRLRARKAAMLGVLERGKGYAPAPVRCVEGDCGVTTAIQLESEQRMRAVQAALKAQGLSATSPIDSGMHVYSNWEPILAQRGAHHPKQNPFARAGRKYRYSKDMCPRTLDILSRTLYVGTPYRDTMAQARQRARGVRRVLEGT